MTNTPTRLYKGTPATGFTTLFTATSKTIVTSITVTCGLGESTDVTLTLAGTNVVSALPCTSQSVTTLSPNHVLENGETLAGLFSASLGSLMISGVVIT